LDHGEKEGLGKVYDDEGQIILHEGERVLAQEENFVLNLKTTWGFFGGTPVVPSARGKAFLTDKRLVFIEDKTPATSVIGKSKSSGGTKSYAVPMSTPGTTVNFAGDDENARAFVDIPIREMIGCEIRVDAVTQNQQINVYVLAEGDQCHMMFMGKEDNNFHKRFFNKKVASVSELNENLADLFKNTTWIYTEEEKKALGLDKDPDTIPEDDPRRIEFEKEIIAVLIEARESIDKAKAVGGETKMAEKLLINVKGLMEKGDFDKARDYAHKSLKIAKKIIESKIGKQVVSAPDQKPVAVPTQSTAGSIPSAAPVSGSPAPHPSAADIARQAIEKMDTAVQQAPPPGQQSPQTPKPQESQTSPPAQSTVQTPTVPPYTTAQPQQPPQQSPQQSPQPSTPPLPTGNDPEPMDVEKPESSQLPSPADGPELTPLSPMEPIDEESILTPLDNDQAQDGNALGQFQMESGMSYLVEEAQPGHCYELFIQQMGTGRAGMCITRSNPRLLTRRFDLGNADVRWLTDSPVDGKKVKPKLEVLMNPLEEFIRRDQRGVLIIDGIEYLISIHRFTATVKFLRAVIDLVSGSDVIFIMPINPSAMDDQNLNIVRREIGNVVNPPA